MLYKKALESSPLWIRMPGTPFTMVGNGTHYERLPGMNDWASRDLITRMAKGINQNTPVTELQQVEGERGRNEAVGYGVGAGLVAGGLTSRVVGGEKVWTPFKDVLKKGVTRDTLRGLAKIPNVYKALPLVGAGLGAAYTYNNWHNKKNDRINQAGDVAKGLLIERVLQNKKLVDAQLTL